MDNNNDSNQFNSNQSDSTKKVIITVVVIALLLGLAYVLLNNDKVAEEDLNTSPSQIQELEVDEKQRVLEAQLKDLQQRAEALTPEASRSDRFVVYIQLAETYNFLGEPEKALESLDTIKEENTGNTRLWMTYAQVYKEKGDVSAARANVDMAMDIDDGIADNWIFLLDLSKDLPATELDVLYKEALTKTENDPKITQAYDTWKAGQAQ